MTENNLRLGGVVTYWSVGEWSSLEKLKSGLEDAGFPTHCPEARTPASCLKDALNELFAGRDELIRPLSTKDGFTVVKERRGESENDYERVCSARIDPDSLAITLSPYSWEKAQELGDRFNRYVGLVRPAQVSACLVAIIQSLGGVRLRPSGAVYWLHNCWLSEWEKVAAAAEQCGEKPNSVYVLRHQMDADAVRAVRDAVVEEVTSASARLHAEVTHGEFGERALKARQAEAEALREKIKLYEDLLGVGLTSLHLSLDTAEQAAAAACLLASAGGAAEMAHAG